MSNPFDQLSKKIGLRALAASGLTAAQHEIPSNAQQVDLRHEPDPTREAERSRLGLLGRMASIPCLIESFSSAPGEEKVLACVGKLIAFRQERRKADKAGQEGEAKPALAVGKPFLWIITAGRPSSALSLLGAVPLPGWPRGVYVSPGEPLDLEGTGPPDLGGMLRVGIVVANELPRERDTILVRIMAGGAALPAALADLASLQAGAYEQEVASRDVVELRRFLDRKPVRSVEEEEFIVSTSDAFEELREEGRQEEAARAVLAVLRVRGIVVEGSARDRILAQKDCAVLERWHERAVVATSVGDVFGEPS